jgi:methyl-accepting chemotaxis protein
MKGEGMGADDRMPRRIKVIDGRLQYLMIAVALTTIVAGLLLFTGIAALYYLLARGGRGLTPELFLALLPPLLLNDLAIMVLFIAAGVIFTNRIAGPAYRMERDIDRALAGERGVRVHLRRRDAFAELAEKVNRVLDRLDDARGS